MTDEQTPAPKTEATHEVEMVQKAIDSGAFQLPTQFKSAEDLVNSYRELQGHSTKLSQENAELKEATTAPVVPETPPIEDLGAAVKPQPNETLTPTGVDWGKVDKELLQTNDLSQETMAALQEAQIPADLVKAKIENHQRRVKEDAAEAAKVVGGADELKTTLQWARDKFTESEAATLAEQLRGPGWKLALMGLHQLRKGDATAKPNEPTVNISDVASNVDVSHAPRPFETDKEMTAAISAINLETGQRKYDTDPEYRKEVQKRIIASNIIQGQVTNKDTGQTYKFGRR